MATKEIKNKTIAVVMTESQLKRLKRFMINEDIFSHSAAALKLMEEALEMRELA